MAHLSIHLPKTISMKTTLMFCLAIMLAFVACNKEDKDLKVCEVSGRITVWGLDAPAVISPTDFPRVELYEMKSLSTGDPWNPDLTYKVPLALTAVNASGEYSLSVELEKEGKYFIEVIRFDTALYFGSKPVSVQFKENQTVNPEVVARAWVTPRFVNPMYQPGDTFVYLYGIGGSFAAPPAITSADATMPWMFSTWGGPEYDKNSREVRGRIVRQGVATDTVIKYFIAPGATAVVDINW
jgi:hypothetical protein